MNIEALNKSHVQSILEKIKEPSSIGSNSFETPHNRLSELPSSFETPHEVFDVRKYVIVLNGDTASFSDPIVIQKSKLKTAIVDAPTSLVSRLLGAKKTMVIPYLEPDGEEKILFNNRTMKFEDFKKTTTSIHDLVEQMIPKDKILTDEMAHDLAKEINTKYEAGIKEKYLKLVTDAFNYGKVISIKKTISFNESDSYIELQKTKDGIKISGLRPNDCYVLKDQLPQFITSEEDKHNFLKKINSITQSMNEAMDEARGKMTGAARISLVKSKFTDVPTENKNDYKIKP